MQSQIPDEMPKAKKAHGIELVAVQCSVCVCVLIAAVCLRMIGGDVYAACTALFRDAMTEQHVMSAPSANAKAFSVPRESDIQPKVTNVALDTENKQQAAAAASATRIAAPLTGGVLTSSFGERTDPFDSTKTSFHYGMDVAAEEGTPLAAMMKGTVAEVGYEEYGYGHYVKIERDKTHSYLYAHCSEVLCEVGQTVEVGQMVARVGNTGRSTGSHVHIEWRVNGAAQDPSTVVPSETYA